MDSRPEIEAQVTGDSSYSSTSRGIYEVFLSFSGTDTRKGFTDFLYTYLVDANIRTFRDDDELRVGEKIGGQLLKAIKESKISIPIFSKSYASSKWCLRELEKMVQCYTFEGQMIYPIFYDVKPFEVQGQTGCYEKAFLVHEQNSDEVQGWKEAMKVVGKLKGLELMKETNGHEGQLIKKVVQELLLVLKKNYTPLDDYLVGMDGHDKAMNELLNLDSNGIRVVGIHGMGGLGKTTIAKFIYNQVCDRFECCCFLEDVRANSVDHSGIVDLQKQLLSKIRKGEVSNIRTVSEGIAEIKGVIGTKKVFIILDDVDDKCQVDKLVGNCHLFGAGSRIIVTTRNKEILDTLAATYQMENQHDVYRSYEPHLMNFNDSLKLFSRSAFMRDSPPKGYDILANKVVSSAGGLPLVLENIGSLLFGKKDIALWGAKLKKLEKIPHEKVLERLRISYDALEYTQKQIFLDIACLFIGEDYVYPWYMWDACGFYPTDGLNALFLRHMVKIKDDNTLVMHDHLRDLGRQIVREENMIEKGERSRLWSSKDAFDLLEGRMMTTKVQAFNLGLRRGWDNRSWRWDDRSQRLLGANFARLQQLCVQALYLWLGQGSDDRSQRLVGDDFTQLRNLRFLKLGWADLDGDFKQNLSNLRWLEWKCPGNFWPNNCCLKNLVILDLQESCITDDWKGWGEIKMAKKLKILILRWCNGLKRGLVLSEFTTLEILCLGGCDYLEEIDPPIRYLTNLRVLDISHCNKLRTFDCSPFSTLENLNLSSCTSLRILHCSDPLESLRYMDMHDCDCLKKLPDLSNFKNLKKLQLGGCGELTEIQGLDMLECLEHLEMGSCTSIERLPNLSNLRMLKALSLSYCEKLREVGELEGLESLEDLDMFSCTSIERLPNLSNLRMLKKLSLSHCKKLLEVGELEGLESLEDLDMDGCMSIERLSNLSNLGKLKKLSLSGCEKLLEVDGFEGLESLEDLDMDGCLSIERLPNLSNLGKLKKLRLFGCEKLLEVDGFEGLESLEDLNMDGCMSIERLPNLSNLGKLKKLCLRGCKKLIEVEGLRVLKSLESLDLSFCTSLEEVEDLSNLKNLKYLHLAGLRNDEDPFNDWHYYVP